MIKSFFVITSPLLIFSCRVNPNAPSSERDINPREVIMSDIELIIRNNIRFRDNPTNEGGNENNAYQPSAYIEGRKPAWMTNSTIAHICIIALIASDFNFNKNNWDSFFDGIQKADREAVRKKLNELSSMSYSKIVADYTIGPHLDYEQYRQKVLSFQK